MMRVFISLSAGAVLLAAVTVPSVSAAQRPRLSWLDRAPQQWNRSRASVPHAPPVDRDDIPAICQPIQQRTATVEERAVTTAGWIVFKSAANGRGITVVSASATLDGMCRPDWYQDFVFLNSRFAGTLSPALMRARGDGSSIDVSFPVPDTIAARFDRYVATDRRCCPSRTSLVTYQVRRSGAGPMVVVTRVRTR